MVNMIGGGGVQIEGFEKCKCEIAKVMSEEGGQLGAAPRYTLA